MAKGIFCPDHVVLPVCYMMLKGLLKNNDPSLKKQHVSGRKRWKVFTSVTLPPNFTWLGQRISRLIY